MQYVHPSNFPHFARPRKCPGVTKRGPQPAQGRRVVSRIDGCIVNGCSIQCQNVWTYGGFHKWGYPTMVGLEWKILLKWMIRGYPYDSGNHHIFNGSKYPVVLQRLAVEHGPFKQVF